MSSRYAGRTDIAEIRKEAKQSEFERAARSKLIDEGREMRSKELELRRQDELDSDDTYRTRDGGSLSNLSSSNASRHNHQLLSAVETNHSGITTYHGARNSDVRELRSELSRLDEKFRSVMMVNVQLDNDKKILRYEVDLLKDKLEDLTDANASLQKAFLEKKREWSYQKMQISELTYRLEFARQQLEARDKLLVEHDLVLLGGVDFQDIPPAKPPAPSSRLHPSNLSSKAPSPSLSDVDEAPRPPKSVSSSMHNGDAALPSVNGEITITPPSMALISKALASQLNSLPETSLEAQITHLFNSRRELTARVAKLEAQMEEERRSEEPGSRLSQIRDSRLNSSSQAELKRELQTVRSQAQEFKYKLQEAIQKNHGLETDIVRLEGQVKRYKTVADACEQQENELRTKYRQRHRELLDMHSTLEELKDQNASLKRKIDRTTRASLAPSSGLPPSSATPRGTRESSLKR